jgi:hypothetical protein
MKAMATKGEAYLAKDFKDLPKIVEPLVEGLCQPALRAQSITICPVGPTPAPPAPEGEQDPPPPPPPRPTPAPPVQGCAGKKDVMIMLDASKSVNGGWDFEAKFAAKIIEEITKDGNPQGHRINLHYFNTHTYPIGSSGAENSPGQFTTNSGSLVSALKGLNYFKIRAGATDHPQVFMTSEDAFKKDGRRDAEQILILITDGATHKCECKGFSESQAARKIGKCKGNKKHPCGQPTGNDPACATQCLCGLYKAALFKEKGHQLILAGITNQHHSGQTEAGRFQIVMKAMASDEKAYVAKGFGDLSKLVDPLVNNMCS